MAQQLRNVFQLFSEEDADEQTGPGRHQSHVARTQEPSQVYFNLQHTKSPGGLTILAINFV